MISDGGEFEDQVKKSAGKKQYIFKTKNNIKEMYISFL